MKKPAKGIFFVVLILILTLAYTAIFGVYSQNGDNVTTYIKGASDIRWGIDIKGGVEATFSPAEGITASSEELSAAKTRIELRMVSSGITDYELYTDDSNNRIIVRFPWKSDEADFNPEEAIKELSATSLLTFRPGDEYETAELDSNGEEVYKVPSGETAETILLTGADVESASPMVQPTESGASEYVVALEFTDEGAEKFRVATGSMVGEIISIWMDDVRISAAQVQGEIAGGSAVISGNFTLEEVTALASQIEGGALPFAMDVTNYSTVNPILGLSSLDAMTLAGIIAFIAVAIFMILMFRLPGFVAVLCLSGQLAISFAAVSGYLPFMNSFTMTLPGIAGMVLSIGIGVDANIITASRIKEELLSGKTLDGSIYKGCQNSFSAIVDGNITIIIVALMLIGVFGPGNILSQIFGESTTGAIYSFGYTLLVGVIANFIMGVCASRIMLKSLSGFKSLRKKWLYASLKPKKEDIDFYGKRKIFFILSSALIALGIIVNVIFGANLDIQFAGGAVIKYNVDGEVDQSQVADIVENSSGRSASVTTNYVLSTDTHQVTVNFAGNESLSLDEQENIATALSENYADRTFEVASSNTVDPQMGAQFFQKSLVCFGITIVLLLLFIAFRFRKIGGITAGVTAVIALVHDVLIVYFVFIVFGMSINDIFIAVILTIVGYSLNDTIVIYDRVRENKLSMPSGTSIETVVNTGLNQIFSRSVFTSLTTLLVLAIIYIVSTIYAIDTVANFALPMMIGVVSGCYSSLFIATPLYTMIEKKEP